MIGGSHIAETVHTKAHGKGGRAGTSLGLHNLITTKLNALHQVLVLLALHVLAVLHLAQEGDDGDTRVATDDSHLDVLGVGVLDLAQEAGSADNVEGGDAENALLVKDALLLVDLGKDGDGRVDGVGDDEDVGLGAVFGTGLGEGLDDGGVGVLCDQYRIGYRIKLRVPVDTVSSRHAGIGAFIPVGAPAPACGPSPAFSHPPHNPAFPCPYNLVLF